MDLRFTFDEDERNYDQYRPGYPEELFQDLFVYAPVGADSRVLEIGIGTGQATLPFLRRGCRVTAVELGERLSAFAAEKYRDYANLEVVQGDFMQVPLAENSLDLIYSATAFHWLPAKEAYRKVTRALKPGGTLALFWNHPFVSREEDASNVASCRVYDRLRPSGQEQTEFSEADCRRRAGELERFGFQAVESHLYRRVRELSTDDYLHLLNTYSDHRALDPALKERFEAEMRAAIDGVGGTIRIYDTLDLYLARTP